MRSPSERWRNGSPLSYDSAGVCLMRSEASQLAGAGRGLKPSQHGVLGELVFHNSFELTLCVFCAWSVSAR